jgi:hypothetical protein
MANAKELAERARMFEERAKKRPIRYPGNTTGKWPPTIDRCQSNIRTWSVRPRDRSPAPDCLSMTQGSPLVSPGLRGQSWPLHGSPALLCSGRCWPNLNLQCATMTYV